MAQVFLRQTKVKGHSYFQIAETVYEEKQKRTRILVHLGPDLSSDAALLKWWEFLEKPLIPYKLGRFPGSWSHVIINLDLFLRSPDLKPDRELVVAGLKQLTKGYRLRPGTAKEDYNWFLERPGKGETDEEPPGS